MTMMHQACRLVAAQASRRAVVRVPVLATGRCSYSSTSFLQKKKQKDIDAEFEAYYNSLDQPDVQFMHMDPVSDEEAKKILQDQLDKEAEEEAAKFIPNWKPGMRKRWLKHANTLEPFEIELMGEDAWTLRSKRCGALALKVGMLPVWDHWGEEYVCTVLFLDSNIVLGHKTMEKHGYRSVQIGAGERKKKNVKGTILGQYKDIPEVQEHPPYIIREFAISDDTSYPDIGMKLHARHFVPGQNVDVSGISKGKGFQGAMKRWNFSGMPASHGVSKSHRALGATGQCQDPGRVFKGKKMAGNMGNERVTVQNLRVVKIDRGRNLIYVKGHVPGQKGNFVEIRDAVKKPLWRSDQIEGSPDRPPLPSFEFDAQVDGTGEKYEEFMPLPEQDPMLPEEEEAA